MRRLLRSKSTCHAACPAFQSWDCRKTTVKESKERVRSALINNQFEFPLRRITTNLAPADLPKEGGRFDLPIALGILLASGQLPDYGDRRLRIYRGTVINRRTARH